MHLYILFKSMAPSSIDTILKQHNSGNLAVSGCIKWLGEPVRPQHTTKMVREAEIVDLSGATNFAVWETHIQQIEEEKILHCHQLQAQAVKQLPKHKTRIPMFSHHRDNQILGVLCPEMMKTITKKISENPGSNIVHCLHCII